jgi:excisionase family DNA binding protein
MDSTKSYHTVRETASRLRVSCATIRRLIQAGKLRALRVGRSVRIEGGAFDATPKKGGVR